MKEDTRKRLAELIVEELASKIRTSDELREKLEPFAHLSVEKVADAILAQIDGLLSGDLREMFPPAPAQPPAAPPPATPSVAQPPVPPQPAKPPAPLSQQIPVPHSQQIPPPVPLKAKEPPAPPRPVTEPVVKQSPTSVHAPAGQPRSEESIMRHFGQKEPFPSQEFNIELSADDWLYLYGFSYAPDSTGKGVPARMLTMKGIDKLNNIFMIDFGDIRLYLNKLTLKDVSLDNLKRPVLPAHMESRFKLEHETILNVLRSEEVMVCLPMWTIRQGMEEVLKTTEDRYVDMLKTMIDVHDAVDWDLELFAFDHHILQLPSISTGTKGRTTGRRETKPAGAGRRDDVMIDKVIFREKTIAQEIHNQLILTAQKSKLDYMIRLENAFMDDWKSILAARYTVGKDKRHQFWQSVKSLQEEYAEYELMLKVRTPSDHFSL